VDGTPTIADAYLGGEWKTVLLGTTGVGGKTVFALDVTYPQDFSSSDVLWEFTDPELGRGVSDAQIVRLDTGKWVAVFGNGYNSTSHEAALFVVDLSNGTLLSKVSTGAGDADDPNGLATPAIMVDPQTGEAIRAYAGDLQGNIWRFNLEGGASKADLLFTATNAAGEAQPITAAPRLAYVPGGDASEVIVLFGTGAYFRTGDKSDLRVQSLYGVYDDGTAKSVARKDLLEQEITSHEPVEYTVKAGATSELQDVVVRTVSDNAIGDSHKGWVLDLDAVSGERVVSPAAFPSGYPVKRVRFSTLIPESNACGSGQTGCVLDIDVKTGGKTADHVFDLNRDGKYDLGDAAESDIVNGVCEVLSGERITVISENGNDRVLDSEIVEVGDDYDGPVVDPPDPPGPGGDDPDDPAPGQEPPCTGPLCIEGNDMGFGRQNWEELR
jgi:type IV pilus assembly protein PilY1